MPILRTILAATRPERSADADATPGTDMGERGGVSTLPSVARIAMAGIGLLLVRSGLKDRSLLGLGKATLGGVLIYRGVRGRRRSMRPKTTTEGTLADETADANVIEVDRSITIDADAEELSEMLRDPETLSEILGNVAVVTAVGEDQHRWTVRGPMDRTVTLQTRVVEERPGELLRWESTGDGPVSMEGSVRFRSAPADQGTEVRLHVRIEPPGGRLAARALGELDLVPRTAAGGILHRFKSLAETGEVPTLEGNPSGRGRGDVV